MSVHFFNGIHLAQKDCEILVFGEGRVNLGGFIVALCPDFLGAARGEGQDGLAAAVACARMLLAWRTPWFSNSSAAPLRAAVILSMILAWDPGSYWRRRTEALETLMP